MNRIEMAVLENGDILAIEDHETLINVLRRKSNSGEIIWERKPLMPNDQFTEIEMTFDPNRALVWSFNCYLSTVDLTNGTILHNEWVK